MKMRGLNPQRKKIHLHIGAGIYPAHAPGQTEVKDPASAFSFLGAAEKKGQPRRNGVDRLICASTT
jgi:hypothetical protein